MACDVDIEAGEGEMTKLTIVIEEDAGQRGKAKVKRRSVNRK